MTIQSNNQPICPRCSSGQVYIRFKTQELVCRRCGHIVLLLEQNPILENGNEIQQDTNQNPATGTDKETPPEACSDVRFLNDQGTETVPAPSTREVIVDSSTGTETPSSSS